MLASVLVLVTILLLASVLESVPGFLLPFISISIAHAAASLHKPLV